MPILTLIKSPDFVISKVNSLSCYNQDSSPEIPWKVAWPVEVIVYDRLIKVYCIEFIYINKMY